MKKILLVGAYHEMIEVCEDAGYEIVGIIDNKETREYYGVPVLGTDDDAAQLIKRYPDVPVVISPFMPKARKKLYDERVNNNAKYTNLRCCSSH